MCRFRVDLMYILASITSAVVDVSREILGAWQECESEIGVYERLSKHNIPHPASLVHRDMYSLHAIEKTICQYLSTPKILETNLLRSFSIARRVHMQGECIFAA